MEMLSVHRRDIRTVAICSNIDNSQAQRSQLTGELIRFDLGPINTTKTNHKIASNLSFSLSLSLSLYLSSSYLLAAASATRALCSSSAFSFAKRRFAALLNPEGARATFDSTAATALLLSSSSSSFVAVSLAACHALNCFACSACNVVMATAAASCAAALPALPDFCALVMDFLLACSSF
jgi:hypothetical protein